MAARIGARIRPELLDEALGRAVRASVVAGATSGAVAYMLGALRGASHFIPMLEVEWRGTGRGSSSAAEQVVTRMEVDAEGRRTITRTTTKMTDTGERRVQKESLKSTDPPSARSLLQGLPFPPLPFGLSDRRWSFPLRETFAGRTLDGIIGTAASAAWCALCTLPVARGTWRASMFGTRALALRANPGSIGSLVGLRVCVLTWLGGTAVAGTIGSGGIALVGIPSAMLAGLPVLATGLVIFPLAHRHVALRLVRQCIL
ncbi:hypothetical protein KFE25_013504 [Diacronema lutheri]|uniref:Uncharacterized protein n=1 Tax=Diacronema lutheri TaxID=2081491 RepID=A0A8J5XT16_DIALT|nr:hypothetical protein KFE25_013504 [Diacronema lutheri]